MAEWRWFRSWTEEELVSRLDAARELACNFSAGSGQMTLENGWNQVCSQAVVGREAPGLPEPGGTFERALQVLDTFDFSDPRIVEWHFAPEDPLEGRTVLLELKSLDRRLNYLCPARVGGTRLEQDSERTVHGFSFETLEGHIEQGREWFLLSKDHASGVVRFRIEASWRPGTFPNWWSRLGFLLVGRRYQRAWHRLTHVRLRELTYRHPHLLEEPLPGDALIHSGHQFPIEPVQLYARRATGARKSQPEVEMETVHRGKWWTPVGLGVIAGMRSMSAPALLSRSLSHAPGLRSGPLSRLLGKRSVSGVLNILALGEFVGDKLPTTPARVTAIPLAGRVLTGALVGATSSGGGRGSRALLIGAGLGALAAFASTHAFYALRRFVTRELRVPDGLAAIAEDALVVTLGTRLLPVMDTGEGEFEPAT